MTIPYWAARREHHPRWAGRQAGSSALPHTRLGTADINTTIDIILIILIIIWVDRIIAHQITHYYIHDHDETAYGVIDR